MKWNLIFGSLYLLQIFLSYKKYHSGTICKGVSNPHTFQKEIPRRLGTEGTAITTSNSWNNRFMKFRKDKSKMKLKQKRKDMRIRHAISY